MADRRRLRISDLTAIAVPAEPAISPDGRHVVYVLRTSDAEGDRELRSLWWVTVGSGAPRPLTQGPADYAPAWSPDGAHVAFLRAGDGSPAQMCLMTVGSGETEELTQLPQGVGRPVWSPDGTRLAFTALVRAETEGSAGEVPANAGRRTHVHVLHVVTRELTRFTEGFRSAGEPSWSPDGTRLALPAVRDRGADPTGTCTAQVLDVARPAAAPARAGPPAGTAETVSWHADGAGLLVRGQEGPGPGHSRLWRVPLDGGRPSDLTGRLDRNVMSAALGSRYRREAGGPGEREALVLLRDEGCFHLYGVGVDSAKWRVVVGGAGRSVCAATTAEGSGTLALVLATPTSYGEIVVVDPTDDIERILTAHGDMGLPGVALYPPVERRFTVPDGTVVQGWVVRDPGAARPGPLLLDIHGGPHTAWNGTADGARLYQQVLAARGWTVLLVNPRGSDGYGERFYTQVVGGWGRVDAGDLLYAVDELVRDGTADPGRLAVAGYSYGGYQTCFLTSRDRRFAAAVASAAISDVVSWTRTSDIGRTTAEQELGGAPGTVPDRYAASNPMSQVSAVHTPTLLLHGAEDIRCPADQARQWFDALRARHVPTRLVLYPGESHTFVFEGRPSHRTDWNRRIVDWLEKYAASPARP
ncbi:prolyl oligopeptidase family serine peptidase [Streptomyces sp. NPDC048508]|uniref:S9 family peptidase n=1 Tax=Streptomyces sp. NPDC048508 TaxID=3365561 RepID=UPI003718E276